MFLLSERRSHFLINVVFPVIHFCSAYNGVRKGDDDDDEGDNDDDSSSLITVIECTKH